jgi:hypothetical protein
MSQHTPCPHCGENLNEEQIRSLWGHYTASLRTAPPKAGPGRGHKKKPAKATDRRKDKES